MKISFRQGIIRYQRDPSGLATFLQKSSGSGGGAIDLVTANDPFIATFAYRQANYLHEESTTVPRAWSGFESNIDYWLYIDIDMVTAQRSFGHTTLEPTFGSFAGGSLAIGQHWFDVVASTMKVWNGVSWSEKTRLFVAKYAAGSIIQPVSLGSQVQVNTVNDAGFILFDADGYPVRQHHKRKSFEYLTTASIFNTVTAKAINVSLDAICTSVRASEPIPAFSLVTYDATAADEAVIKAADSQDRGHYAIGIVQEDFWTDETGIITQHGYVYNEQWNFTDAPGSLLFLGRDGNITVDPAQTGVIQRVGEVVSPQCIRLEIQPAIRFVDDTVVDYTNLIPMVMDKVTGEPMMAMGFDQKAIEIVGALLKDASKLPVTALGGDKHLLEEWTANFLAADLDHERRIAVLEAIAALPEPNVTVDYNRETPMTITVGGATPGTTFQGTVQDALDKILYPFGVPKFSAFSIRDASTVLEVGSTFPGGMRVFNWTTVNPLNIKPRSLSIVDSNTNTVLAGGLVDTGSTSIMLGADITNTTPSQYTWTINAVDTQEGALSRQFTVAWRWKVYYGNNMFESMIGSDVLALTGSSITGSAAGSYVMPASGYKWLCYPSTYPTLTSFKDQATGLNVAINDPILVTVVNRYGLSQVYKCHRTYNMLGSSITVVAS